MTDVLFKTYVFLGLGLIGGSIARTIRKYDKTAVIYAYDLDSSNTIEALEEGIIDEISSDISSHVAKADLLILAAPVGCNIDNLKKIASLIPGSCCITDVGSVKSGIHDTVRALHLERQFIGGHPMTGKETSGFAASTERLLENAYYILTPTNDTDDLFREQMLSFVLSLHALPLLSNPEQHDYATAAISHLPHLIAASLVSLVSAEDSEDHFMKTIAAGGFKDLTRIASSSPSMWEHICQDNSDNISHLLTRYIATLNDVKAILEHQEYDKIATLFTTSGAYRSSMSETKNGAILRDYRLYVDIPDETGVIAGIATLLANNNINIKNIGITHNREQSEGALYIVFNDKIGMNAAIPVLKDNGYIVMVG